MYPEGHRFQQDNDPKHTSNLAKLFMETHGINHWPTPPESPDMNPIEMVWNELKVHLNKRVKPSNKQELITGITDFWWHFSRAKCNTYIDHLYKVLPIVIDRNGKASGH